MTAATAHPPAERRARGATRSTMLIAAADLLRERGPAGVTIDAVLARSGSPRGSVYHHFPEGRAQIIREALEFAGEEITRQIEQAAGGDGTALLRQFVVLWREALIASDFTAVSPVLAVSVGAGPDDLGAVAAGIFLRWRDAAVGAFRREGFGPEESASLAHTTMAALEGALVLCRATRSTRPLDDTAAQLEFLISAREFVSRANGPTA